MSRFNSQHARYHKDLYPHQEEDDETPLMLSPQRYIAPPSLSGLESISSITSSLSNVMSTVSKESTHSFQSDIDEENAEMINNRFIRQIPQTHSETHIYRSPHYSTRDQHDKSNQNHFGQNENINSNNNNSNNNNNLNPQNNQPESQYPSHLEDKSYEHYLDDNDIDCNTDINCNMNRVESLIYHIPVILLITCFCLIMYVTFQATHINYQFRSHKHFTQQLQSQEQLNKILSLYRNDNNKHPMNDKVHGNNNANMISSENKPTDRPNSNYDQSNNNPSTNNDHTNDSHQQELPITQQQQYQPQPNIILNQQQHSNSNNNNNPNNNVNQYSNDNTNTNIQQQEMLLLIDDFFQQSLHNRNIKIELVNDFLNEMVITQQEKQSHNNPNGIDDIDEYVQGQNDVNSIDENDIGQVNENNTTVESLNENNNSLSIIPNEGSQITNISHSHPESTEEGINNDIHDSNINTNSDDDNDDNVNQGDNINDGHNEEHHISINDDNIEGDQNNGENRNFEHDDDNDNYDLNDELPQDVIIDQESTLSNDVKENDTNITGLSNDSKNAQLHQNQQKQSNRFRSKISSQSRLNIVTEPSLITSDEINNDINIKNDHDNIDKENFTKNSHNNNDSNITNSDSHQPIHSQQFSNIKKRTINNKLPSFTRHTSSTNLDSIQKIDSISTINDSNTHSNQHDTNGLSKDQHKIQNNNKNQQQKQYDTIFTLPSDQYKPLLRSLTYNSICEDVFDDIIGSLDSINHNIIEQADCIDDRDCIRFTSPLQCFTLQQFNNNLVDTSDQIKKVFEKKNNKNGESQHIQTISFNNITQIFSLERIYEFNTKLQQYSQTNIDFNLQPISLLTSTTQFTTTQSTNDTTSITSDSPVLSHINNDNVIPLPFLSQLSQTTCPIAIHRNDEEILYQIHLRLNELLCDDWFKQQCTMYFNQQIYLYQLQHHYHQLLLQQSKIKHQQHDNEIDKIGDKNHINDDGNNVNSDTNDKNNINGNNRNNGVSQKPIQQPPYKSKSTDIFSHCGPSSSLFNPIQSSLQKRATTLGKLKCIEKKCHTIY